MGLASDQSETQPAEPPSTLTRNQVFDLLSNQRRRCVLHYLTQRNGEWTSLRELSAQIAAWETHQPIEQLTGEERRRVYTSLQQFHLPKMHQNGVIEYDDQQSTVTLTNASRSLNIYLDVVPDRDIPWSLYYAGLSALSFVFIAGSIIGLYPTTILPDIAWAVFTATVFAVSAVVHVYETRRNRLGSDGPPPDLRGQ